MTTRLIKWAVIAALMLAIGWTCYQWGQSVARENAAEARTEAVAQARQEARAKMQEAVDAARERAQQHAQRAEKLESELDALESKAERYAASEAGQKECLGEPGMEAWNEL